MWIVRLALRRPYTVAVMALLILIMGMLSLTRMIVDIFPPIDIPVVAVVWSYNGLSAEDMERRVVLISERAFSTTVNGIQRIESQSIPGIGLMRIYFQPDTEIGAAIAQISSVSSTILRILPPGMTPPNVIQFNASNVPVAQLTISSPTLPEERIFDYGLNFVRVKLFTIPGLSTPAPFGGKQRQINVDVDPRALAGKGLSPADVVAALQSSNLIIPAGTARIGDREYNVLLNSSPSAVEQFASIPIKIVGNVPVLLGDVARVPDGFFVRAAIRGVVREAIISSVLVSLLIGLFLGSWRSMVIVCTSIPLAIFSAIVGLKLAGHGINIMTLGGLALAIGMLVDDATVEVENIHRNRGLGKPLTVAILDGARQVAVPAIVATLSICIVFFPVVLLEGPAKFLFTPLALSVVLAMLASYLLSRTLVPVLARLLMRGERSHPDRVGGGRGGSLVERFNVAQDRSFARFQGAYARVLESLLAHRAFILLVAGAVIALSLGLTFIVGTDFFPMVDAGLMKLHVRAPAGTRVERTEELVSAVEARIRRIIPSDELETINDMLGVPVFYNLAFVQTENIGGMDAEILIALRPRHQPTATYMRRLREELPAAFPGSSFYFQSADIVSQVLNFGLSAPIDLQVDFPDLRRSYEVARRLRDALRRIPGAADVRIAQVLDYPALQIDVDRERAAEVGLAQRDVANSLLVSLSSSSLVAPSYFLNPANNVNYAVAVKTPLAQLRSVSDLLSTPVTPPSAGGLLQADGLPPPANVPEAATTSLSNVAELYPRASATLVSHATVQRVLDVEAGVDGRDLGSVAGDIREAIARLGTLPPGMRVTLRGQSEVMNESFRNLGLGLILAIVLVYCLMAILYQSWLDPFIIMMAVPGALAGIPWMLALTGTTLNVESMMGAIMAVGIAVSNSILLVNFANDIRVENGISPVAAALEAGKTRLRPVLLTALAMVLGMVPMALALGEGGEQNAPLGRAVIGGLVAATVGTLFIVPVIYSLLRVKLPTKHLLDERFLLEERGEEPEGRPA